MPEPSSLQLMGKPQRHCIKCNRTMAEEKFYTRRDGTKPDLCKECMTMHVDNFNPDTYLWILKELDFTYIEGEWNIIRDRYYAKDPKKMTGMTVLGRYIAKLKLKQFKDHNAWSDNEYWKERNYQKTLINGTPEEQTQAKIDNMREAMENGEITEAQFKSFEEAYAPTTPINIAEPEVTSAEAYLNSPYPQNNPFEEVELTDVGEDLTDEDKKYLAIKWGRLYRPHEWVALEQLYTDFMNSFDIQGAARVDTLKMICKTSLKMNQAIDCGDVESYQKLSRVYDTMMKSAKFTEAQRKEEKSGDFDAVGQIVFFAEKEGGKIPRHELNVSLDKVDEAIKDLKKYNHDLIVNDSGLSQMLENLIKRRESAASQKEDLQKAAAEGLDYVSLTDQDYEEFNQLLEEKGDPALEEEE